ncbi:alpha-ketoglutarate-dependent dioxygenase AlkB, partial [Candidatus Saccharibacteria bacterium]|nr:alpha-ketoglutarate-dependent dioxygenase AlkB [Candidatus Saccharibacteria bacterium]
MAFLYVPAYTFPNSIEQLAGLQLKTKVFNDDQLAKLERYVNQVLRPQLQPVPNVRTGQVGSNPRYSESFGYKYDYVHKIINLPTDPIPTFLQQVLQKSLQIIGLKVEEGYFNQLLVNYYRPGQGIGPHTDDPKFGDIILVISLGSTV